MRLPDAETFWSRVDSSGGPDACWPWTGPCYGRHGEGYGAAGHNMLAHRVAYMLGTGEEIWPGHQVFHLCSYRYPLGDRRVRLCCNPADLCSASPDVKNSYCRLLQRHSHGDHHWARRSRQAAVHLGRGEDVASHKLTEAAVRDIRSRSAQGATRAALAREYGVSPALISLIVRRRVLYLSPHEAHVPYSIELEAGLPDGTTLSANAAQVLSVTKRWPGEPEIAAEAVCGFASVGSCAGTTVVLLAGDGTQELGRVYSVLMTVLYPTTYGTALVAVYCDLPCSRGEPARV